MKEHTLAAHRPSTVSTAIRFDVDVYDLLRQRAREEERSINQTVNRLLRAALKRGNMPGAPRAAS